MMLAAVVPLVILQGADYFQLLRWKSGSAPVDLSGYTGRMQIRETVDSPTVLLSLTTENGRMALGGAAGTIALSLTNEATRSCWWTAGVYDIELVDSGEPEKVIRLIRGPISTIKEVTREVAR